MKSTSSFLICPTTASKLLTLWTSSMKSYTESPVPDSMCSSMTTSIHIA